MGLLMSHDTLALLLLLVWAVPLRAFLAQHGWFPRILYLLSALGFGMFFINSQIRWLLVGLVVIFGARVVPAHGWRKQPGEG